MGPAVERIQRPPRCSFGYVDLIFSLREARLNRLIAHGLVYGLLVGIGGVLFGGIRCAQGHTYSVAAQHQASTAGRIVGKLFGKGGSVSYHYVFSLNGVDRDDTSPVCTTPLAPGACDNKGPVLVYYSFEPFSNSRLENFSDASRHAYRTGELGLGIGLPLLALSAAGLAIRSRNGKGKGVSGWPLIEATIQSVNQRSASNPAMADVADFSYTVNDDYFSGKVRISRCFSTHGASPGDLVDQKIQVRYNPRKPQKYSVPQAEVGGFLLDPYDDSFE